MSVDEFVTEKNTQKRGALPTLTDTEWTKLNTLLTVLKPCKDATELLGGETYVSASILLPQLATLKHQNKCHEDDPLYITRFKTALCTDIVPRYDLLTSNMFLKTATMLDPRHKRLKCIKSNLRDAVVTHLKLLAKLELDSMTNVEENDTESVDGVQAQPPIPKKSRFVYESAEESSDEQEEIATNKSEAIRVVDLYLSMPLLDEESDPLLWWEHHKNSLFPLGNFARKYLACPATSVPSERLFSSAGNIISKKRASLLPQNANKMVCCANWLR